jgi:cutinase
VSVVRVATAVATSVLTALAALTTLEAASASAAPKCSDIEMVFARGTDEPPGLGAVGAALVDTLRPMVKGKSIGTYAVKYPASWDFLEVAAGANDASKRFSPSPVPAPRARSCWAAIRKVPPSSTSSPRHR